MNPARILYVPFDELPTLLGLREPVLAIALYFFGGVSDLMPREVANHRVSEFFRQKIRERVRDPRLAELLTPRGFFIGERRIIAENGYLEIFNQPNVSLVDVKSDPITAVTPTGVRRRAPRNIPSTS